MRRVFIQPVGDPSLTVLHPYGRPLALSGEEVNWSSYWARQLADGAIVIAAAPPAPTADLTAAAPTPAPTARRAALKALSETPDA